MLNAHTATQSYRETQFDIRVFLETLASVVSEDAIDSSRLVESRWADGSVDIVPSKSLVFDMVGNLFSSLSIGSANVKIHDTRNLVVADSTGIRVQVENFDVPNADIQFTGGSIGTIEAQTVTIEDPRTIVTRGSVSNLGAINLQVLKNLECNVLEYSNVTVSDTLNLVNIQPQVNFQVTDNFPGSSQLLSYCSRPARTDSNSIVLTGNVCLADSSGLRDRYKDKFSQSPRGYVRVPIIGEDGYAYTSPVYFSAKGIDTPIKYDSVLGMLCLYPKVSGVYEFNTTYSSWYDSYIFTMEALTPEDNYRVISVRNEYSDSVRACNVWSVVAHSTSSHPTITALNYVTIPPYSQVDFLLWYNESLETHTTIIKMMPMKHLT